MRLAQDEFLRSSVIDGRLVCKGTDLSQKLTYLEKKYGITGVGVKNPSLMDIYKAALKGHQSEKFFIFCSGRRCKGIQRLLEKFMADRRIRAFCLSLSGSSLRNGSNRRRFFFSSVGSRHDFGCHARSVFNPINCGSNFL